MSCRDIGSSMISRDSSRRAMSRRNVATRSPAALPPPRSAHPQHGLLRGADPARGGTPQRLRQAWVAFGHRQDRRPLGNPNHRADDRLRAKPVLLARLETEDLAREIEAAYLAAPILEQLVSAYGAARDPREAHAQHKIA